MHARIHADRITGTSFHTVPAKNARQLVDHKLDGITFIAAARVAFWILTGFDMYALRRTGGRTTQAGHATRLDLCVPSLSIGAEGRGAAGDELCDFVYSYVRCPPQGTPYDADIIEKYSNTFQSVFYI